MSKSQYITGLRSVEQLLATEAADIRRIYRGVPERESARRRRSSIPRSRQALRFSRRIEPDLAQMSGEERHQGVIAEVRRSTAMDEAGLRTLVEQPFGGD